MEESAVGISIENLIGMVIGMGILLVASYLSYSWILGESGDKKMIAELERLEDAIIEGTPEVVITRLDGYFFVYCADPSQDDYDWGDDPFVRGRYCGQPGDESGVSHYLVYYYMLGRMTNGIRGRAFTHGAPEAIGYMCKKNCLCLTKLPKKNNYYHLSNVVKCIELKLDGKPVTAKQIWKEKGNKLGFNYDDKFWAIPKFCKTYDKILTPDSVMNSMRYTVRIKAGDDGGDSCPRDVNFYGTAPAYLGSTKTIGIWDGDDNDYLDVCQPPADVLRAS